MTSTTEHEVLDVEGVEETDEPMKVGDEEVRGLDTIETPTGVVHYHSRSGKGSLTIDPDQGEWTPQQVTALQAIGIATEGPEAVPVANVQQFLHICQASDLDPWMREAYLIVHGKRWWSDRDNAWVDNRKFTLVTGIDGFRKKAEDTGEYVGQVGPEWLHPDKGWLDYWLVKWGPPEAARVGILRKGFDAPVWGVAMYEEFVAKVDEYEGQGRGRSKTGRKVPNAMWEQMPANQLAKCAEAQGHRKAFPRQMRGMYESSEMQRAQAEYEDRQRDERRKAAAQQGRVLAQAKGQQAKPEQPPTEPQQAGDVAEQVVKGMGPTPPQQRDEPAQPQAPAPTEAETRAMLIAEVTWQAQVLGSSVEQMLRRALASAKVESAEALPLASLGTAVVGFRSSVANRLAQDHHPAAEPYAAMVDVQRSLDIKALLGEGEGDKPAAEGQDASEPEVDPSEPHTYVADPDGQCVHCGSVEDANWHI